MMTDATTGAQLVVFDLDGVIARSDTMAALIQKRLLGHPLKAIAGVTPAAAWFLLRAIPSARIRMSQALGRVALAGFDGAGYAKLAREVGGALGRDPRWILADGRAAVLNHQALGDRVLITTGTEAILARAFLDAIGLDEIELIGTTVHFENRRPLYEFHNLGANKVSSLRERVGGARINLFYTDSNLDLPLARLSARTILVNPDARLERIFRWGAGRVEVVRWD